MNSDVGVRELVEMMFWKNVTIYKEMTAQNSFNLEYFLHEDFFPKIRKVLFFEAKITYFSWENFFDANRQKILLSHKMYLICIMTACLIDSCSKENIFDSFISMCAFVNFLSSETLKKIGVNFSDLNPDIIMVIFVRLLKHSFCKDGGIQKFIEYIRDHRYLKWNRNGSPSDLSDDPGAFLSFINQDITKRTESELRVDYFFQGFSNSTKAAIEEMALEVLSTTLVQLPTFPSETGPIMKPDGLRNEERAEKDRKLEANRSSKSWNAALQGCSSAISEPERYEKIIEAVIRHNRSKMPDHRNSNRTLKEACKIVEHLKSRIKSFVEVLDEFDEELEV